MATRSKRVVWSEDDWSKVFIAAYRICDRGGNLPLIHGARFGLSWLLKEAQQTLSPIRHRTWTAVTGLERRKLIDGVNELASMANQRLQVKQPIAVEEPTSGAEAEREPVAITVSLPEAPAQQAAAEAPKIGAFTFEGIGRMLDMYFATKIIDQILPEVLKELVPATVNETVSKAVSYAMANFKPNMIGVPGSLESTMLEDMVSVLDEVKTLRAFITEKLGDIKVSKTHLITVDRGDDLRPLIVVTGAHSQQAADLKQTYEKRLKVQVYTDVNPAKDITQAKVIYVFERHTTKSLTDKLREKVGRDKVVMVSGGLSAIKRNLDRHVAEVANLVNISNGIRTFSLRK